MGLSVTCHRGHLLMSHPSEVASNLESSTPLHRYVEAFNARNVEGMAKVFDENLRTIHPAEPDVDVSTAEPFLTRMQRLWERNIHYHLLRTISRGNPNEGDGEVWGELLALDGSNKPLACEVVIYKVSAGRVMEICVYKLLQPSHPSYQA